MRPRLKRNQEHRAFYLITNRIAGGSLVLGDAEKDKLKRLVIDGQERYGHKVWDYVIMCNHYHLLVELVPAAEMTRDELLARWLMGSASKNPGDPGDGVLEAFRRKVHDLSIIVGNFQQRFTQWFNMRNDRKGRLFGARFDSVLLDGDGCFAKAMAYVTLNPVRALMVPDPAEYQWCGYAERVATGRFRDDDRLIVDYMHQELGLPAKALEGTDDDVLEQLWARFRECLLGHNLGVDSEKLKTVADPLLQNEKPLELEWPDRLRLKSRFLTKGIVAGSKEFVETVMAEQKESLGDLRRKGPVASRAWDDTYCLRKHRRPVG